ncbi:hypothetical protein BaRGS_00009759 [Batillaria attramentaria]|uniref:Apple domain-containing protein n=1 Tax=Batillaria attramentaria TaxID=370345 RepID=A0ABD0LHJ2_9CAEN
MSFRGSTALDEFGTCAHYRLSPYAFVLAVENFCFGQNGKHHGTRTFSRTQGRACLAVGSLINRLASNGQDVRAEVLAKKLETWLEEHGKGDSWLHKRGARDTEHVWTVENGEDENIGKAILLHALGNGALHRSRRHLLQHAQPNSGHHVWRRAALDSLRHFSCEESAQTLFDSVLHDDVYSVRRMALGVFVKHPRRRDVTRKQEDLILRESYNYEAVARVKRNVFERVLFQFKVALPRYEWNKEVGNSKIGASFGVKFQNSIEGMFRVLQGYVDVDVHDKLFAEAHIGLINLQLDLLLVEACYRGRLSYNMNLVKDFTVGLYEDINSAFDHIIGRVMEPMERLATKLASEYQDTTTNTPKSGFAPLANAVKNLPTQTANAVQATTEFNQAADLLGAMPLIKKLQGLTSRAQTLMEDIHSETSELFTNIADVAVVALPFAEKEIRSSVNTVLDVLGKVKDFPNQAFSVIDRAKMRYQLSMMRILEGSKILKQAFSFLSGGKSSWNNAGEEIKSIVSQTKSLIAKLKADFGRRKRRQASGNTFDNYTKCAEVEVGDALVTLYNKSEEMVTQLEIVLNNSPEELQRAMDLMQTQTEILKASFASFKEAIDMIKSRIHALFGLRFHPSFPNQRRDCDDQCGCGYYPTDCKRYGHPGVDLVWNQGWRVPSPVTGMVHVESGGSAVRIKPKTSDFKEYEVYVSNIELHQNYTNQTEFFIEAGQVFAFSKGNNNCNKGHIHIAMKRTSNETGLCHYVDPGPFLDTMQPIPTWHEECREFTFKHAFQVIDFDKLTEGFQSVLTELKRYALDSLKDMAIKKVVDLIPDDSLLAPFKDTALQFLNNLNTSADSLGNLFTSGWDAAKGFFGQIKQNFTFGGLLDMAADSNILKQKLPKLRDIADAARKAMKIPKSLAKLKNLTVGSLGRIWKGIRTGQFSFPAFQSGNFSFPLFKFGNFSLPSLNFNGLRKLIDNVGNFSLPSVNFNGLRDLFDNSGQSSNWTGLGEFLASGKERLLSLLKTTLRDKLCPEIGKWLAKQGSPCIPHEDCMGLSCDITIRRKHLTGKLNVGIKVDKDKKQVTVTVDGKNHTVSGDGDQTVSTGLQLFSAFDVKFRLATVWQGENLQFSLVLQACGPNLCCLPEISLAKNLTFSDIPAALGNIFNGTDIDLEVLPLDLSYKVFTDLNVDSPELTNQILGIKDLISDSLGVELPENTQYSVEFKNPVDHQDQGSFPMAGFSGGAAIGMEFDVKVQAVDSYMKTTITPFVAAKLEAGVSVSIFVFGFGADLHGWIMRTRFPLSLETNYTKQPVVQTKRLEVNLVPVELKLKLSSRRRRSIDSGPPTCMVQQLTGRHPKDTAFYLDFSVSDDDSDVDVSYAIGDYPGGTNVAGWTHMRGSSLVVPDQLPCGKPLHFSVRAVNTQGLYTTAQCSLPTYDCSFPDGRVDAAYRCTSHPSRLSATVIVYEDSELKDEKLFHAVGYSPSSQGHEVVDWLPLVLTGTVAQSGVSGHLRYFTPSRKGRLATIPLQTLKTSTTADCAAQCVGDVTCVSFSFSELLFTCELQSVTEGVHAKRVEDEHFLTYERLGVGYSAVVEYADLPLRHGVVYYVNSAVENVVDYQSVLTSGGTMADQTPPEPGPLGVGAVDTMVADRCTASVAQRCVDVVNTPNHRKIIDGKGGSTVFNGNRRGQDLVFTIENHHAAANWAGFRDMECGIYKFLWAVGISMCGTEISNFTDPHVTMLHPDDWTHLGLAKGLHLAEGNHYVTVQAINDIIHGGDLVTTVCHSLPFIVDITPPVVYGVNEVVFDDTFRFLAVYYNATDALSGLSGLEFGLGKTKYDVMVRKYMPFEMRGTGDNTYLLNEEFETASGVPSWIRIKVVDKVRLSATGFGNTPILLDSTPPIPGKVMDGAKIGQDVCCQNDSSTICVQWRGFEDPESHIDSFLWGVGSAPGKDDIVTFQRKSSHARNACASGLQLEHNATYYSTIVIFNKALNQKSSNASSDGVLIDLTPPVPGVVVDGDDINSDIEFTSETASLSSSWQGFHDPETQIDSYTLSVFVNGDLAEEFTDLSSNASNFTDHSFTLQHGDRVHAEVTGTNRAGASVTVASDGMSVDHTPPVLLSMGTAAQLPFQDEDSMLNFLWEFEDPESGVTEYRYTVFQVQQGRRTRFWPSTGQGEQVLELNNTQADRAQDLLLQGLQLLNGASYSVKVTAINGAKMAAVEESASVTIDKTPPVVEQVHVALLGEEEEVNEDGQVEHIEGEPLHVTWVAYDFESGLTDTQICIGPVGVDCLSSAASHSVDSSPNNMFTTVLNDTSLEISTDDRKVVYQVSLVVTNGAGTTSTVLTSKPIIVLQGNVAGVVQDGRTGEDEDFTNDKASVAATFSGFSSQACGIEVFEWGVGTTPCATDILPYSEVGLVMDQNEEGAGKAQAHVMLKEGGTYYVAVRARTGHNCHEPYIVSCSDGILTDTIPPKVSFYEVEDTSSQPSPSALSQPLTSSDVVYQTVNDLLTVGWRVEDPIGVNRTSLTLDRWGSSPDYISVAAISSQSFQMGYQAASGDSVFSSLRMLDTAGNEAETPLPPVMFDFTPPTFVDFKCTDIVSAVASHVTCTWTSVEERDSAVTTIEFGLGSGPAFADIYSMTSVPLHRNQWTVEVNVTSLQNIREFYVVIAHSSNGAGLKREEPFLVRVDLTPPVVGGVSIVTSSESGGSLVEQRCQSPQDFVEVQVTGAADAESGVARVEIALGSSFGTSDIQGFQEYMLYGGVYARGQLGLAAGTTVFATVRVTNGVGLYTVVRSAGVVISPNPRLEVWDGPGKRDLEGMADLNVIQGRWHFSDPCPIVRAEWAVTELSTGRYVKPFTPIPDSGQVFYDDTLSLENFKTYVSHVRVTDAQNRTYTAYSDGVTVDIQPPDTAAVWEGTGRDDQDYQVTLEELVASWDPFGDPQSVLPSQQILRYEVAVGTDRRWPMTRTNIHGFQDVGLALTHTFHGLNLTAKTVAYYITVRAYSAANTFSESSSDGIRAGYSGEIEPGSVTVDDFQSDVTSIRASWDGFMSDMGEMRYYVGVSMTSPPWDNSTYDCEELLNSTFHFDVQALQSVDSQLMATVDGLRLEHNATYIVTVVAEDLMLHCAAAISNPVLVDTTPPVAGEIAADGYDDGSAMFVHSEKTLIVNLSGFPDAESGIEKATVELIESQGCGVPSDGETLIREVDVDEEWNIAMRNLNLQLGKIYLLRATITNGARLTTTATSKPLLLDTSSPMPGMVKVGTSWTGPERLFQKETDTLQGTIAVVPFDFSSACVTQVDLMSSEYKDSWKEFTGIFSPDCTFIDSSVISLLIQHNPSMTGVDRGAVQIQNLTWREGDYTFRMAPAAGLNVLTGISLASPSLQPPFSSQNGIPVRNGSVWTCDSPGGDCETGSKNKSGERGLLPEGEYGAGLSFMEVNGTMKGLFWAQDRIGLKQTAVSFDTDPSATPADYVFRVKQLESESKEVSLLVNGKTRAAFSGLVFPDNMTLSIYTWNVEDFVPPVVDPFRPFRTVAEVTKVAIPVARKPLCSYGTPFHDSHSGVKEIWAGVSDSLNETANIVPFRKVKSFCTPCLLGCPNLCTAACNSTSKLSPEYNIFSLTLSNITLETGDDVMNSSRSSLSGALPNDTSDNTTSDELKAFRLPMYYLDVRVLAHSGLYADAKSSRVVVDTSRPVVNEIFCVDPLYSSDEPMEFIGSNNTVGLKWDVSEDVTGIAAQLSRQHTLTDLDDSLVDETTYFFNLQVVNQAGLTTNASASFTVLTSPPDMSVVSPAPANVTSVMNISGVPVAFTDSTEKVVVVLKPSTSTSNSSVEYIEWMIGTKPGGQNVFPKTIVANLNVTEVAIVDGHLVIGGDATNITVGDYARSNFVSSNGSASAGSVFHMEPGRCLQQKILGVTKSHREGAVDLEPLCILRPSDTLALPGKSTVNLPVKDLSGSNTQKSQEVDVILSAASTDFSPYIIRPDPQSDPTSRFLRGRTLSTPGPHLYLAPVVAVELDGDIYLAYNVSASVVIPADATVKLVFWDADSQQWKSLEDMCSSSSQTFNSTSGHLVSKVCPEVFSDSTAISNRVKRSVPVQGVSPRMVTVTVVTASMNGNASVTPDGELTYKPNPNFFGDDLVVLQATEVFDAASLAAGVVPNVVNLSVVITVTGRNDPPELFYLKGTNDTNITPELLVGPAAGNGINVSVLVEGNTTTFVDLGLIVFGDVDASDTIIFMNQTRESPDASFSVRDVSPQDDRLASFSITGAPSGVGAKEISLSFTEGYHGTVVYEARVRDAANTYSLQLTLGVHVMISPCVHGHCQSRTPGETCADWQRAHTFDLFLCHCDPGYEGQWCHVETNECRTATCSPVTDCVDLVNGYRCDPNLEKTLAIAFCSLVAVLLAAAGIYKLKKMKKKSKTDPGDSQSLDSFGKPKKYGATNMGGDFTDDDGASATDGRQFFIPRPHTPWSSSGMFSQEQSPSPSTSNTHATELDILSPFQPMPNHGPRIWRPLTTTNITVGEPTPDYPQAETFTSFTCKNRKRSKAVPSRSSAYAADEDYHGSMALTGGNELIVDISRNSPAVFEDVSGGTLHPPPKRSSARGESRPGGGLHSDGHFTHVRESAPLSIEDVVASAWHASEEHVFADVDGDTHLIPPPVRSAGNAKSSGMKPLEENSLCFINPGFSSTSSQNTSHDGGAMVWRPMQSSSGQDISITDHGVSTSSDLDAERGGIPRPAIWRPMQSQPSVPREPDAPDGLGWIRRVTPSGEIEAGWPPMHHSLANTVTQQHTFGGHSIEDQLPFIDE